MQIFREKDYFSRKAKTLLFLLVSQNLVNTIQPGPKKEHPDRSTDMFISRLHFKLKSQGFERKGGIDFQQQHVENLWNGYHYS